MRILYFSLSYTTHDYRFLDALGRAGKEVHFLCLIERDLLRDIRPLPAGVTQLEWRNWGLTRDWPKNQTAIIAEFARLHSQIKPDVVHAGPIDTCTYIAAMAQARPLLAVSWGSDLLVDADRSSQLHDRSCFALRNSDMLLADCTEVADKARILTDYPADRIVQFPWGVDLGQFRPGADLAGVRAQFEQNSFILLSTRRWETSYGIMPLLRGFYEAHKAIPRLRMLLLSTGSLAAQVEEFIENHDLSESIRMPGQIPASTLPDYYRAADLYISCAFSDGSSISLLEAMASGLPVIATQRASNREWVDDNRGGLLLNFGDNDAIRDAIIRIASMTEQERKLWGNHNAATALTRADWSRNFRRLLIAYQDLERLDHSLQG